MKLFVGLWNVVRGRYSRAPRIKSFLTVRSLLVVNLKHTHMNTYVFIESPVWFIEKPAYLMRVIMILANDEVAPDWSPFPDGGDWFAKMWEVKRKSVHVTTSGRTRRTGNRSQEFRASPYFDRRSLSLTRRLYRFLDAQARDVEVKILLKVVRINRPIDHFLWKTLYTYYIL